MTKFTLMQRLRYAFDNSMSRGPIAIIGWLALASVMLIVAIALIVLIGGFAPAGEDGPVSFVDLVWMGLMRTLDAGTMGGDAGGWPFLLSMLAVTLGGVFVVSTLIGVLTAGVEGKLEDLRKGRSMVLENDHTVILGWSEQIFTVLHELVEANANRRRPCIVVLAERDKVKMEDEIREKVPGTRNTRIVCRTGSPIDPVDLDIVNLHGARSIIILSPASEDPDAEVIKTMLAITNGPDRRAEPYHIVAEIHDRKNLEAARLVGGEEAHIVETGDVISRVIVQTCRQSGLSVVYTELLDFGGDEIYFQEEPALAGKTFGEALLGYEDSAVIGLQFRDGRTALNPPMDTRIAAGDKVIAISADDDTVRLSGLSDPGIDAQAIRGVTPAGPVPERTLILGWNRRAPAIIRELDRYVAPGSTATIVADYPEGEAEIMHCCRALRNETVAFVRGDTTDRATLEELRIEQYQHVIVLCYSDMLDHQRADARTLVTLLHLRDMESRRGSSYTIVSEMLDLRNRQLAEVTQADDFIVSDQLISLMLAQVSENKYLNAVFADIFDPEGSEIYLKPPGDYVATGRPVNFYTVVEAARRRGHVAIGYRLAALAGRADKGYGVVVNPDKSREVTFGVEDKIVVIAEE